MCKPQAGPNAGSSPPFIITYSHAAWNSTILHPVQVENFRQLVVICLVWVIVDRWHMMGRTFNRNMAILEFASTVAPSQMPAYRKESSWHLWQITCRVCFSLPQLDQNSYKIVPIPNHLTSFSLLFYFDRPTPMSVSLLLGGYETRSFGTRSLVNPNSGHTFLIIFEALVNILSSKRRFCVC